MKALRSICLCTFALAVLVSCSSPTSVAEKALKIIGKGTFVPTDVDRYAGITPLAVTSLFSDYGDIFDDALQENYEAEYVRKNGVYKKYNTSDILDFSDVLFEKYLLISKDEITTDLYSIDNYVRMKELDLGDSFIEQSKEFNKQFQKDYQESAGCGTWLVEKDLPMYILRYKLDNRYIANITVIKCPDKGYRVCAFRIE